MVNEYRDAHDAWAALRESNVLAPTSVPGAANSGVVCAQLEDDEFKAAFPQPLFKDWLTGYAWPSRDADQEDVA